MNATKLYQTDIDGGEGGGTIFYAESLKNALVQAIEWAQDGDWPDEGCDVDVRVWTEDEDGEVDEELEESVHIPSVAEKLDEKLEDGEVLAENECEFDTERVIFMDGEAYYTHPNGGTRGAHDRQCGDGVWRERPCSPTRKLTRKEARCIMLDWGVAAPEVARLTRQIEA